MTPIPVTIPAPGAAPEPNAGGDQLIVTNIGSSGDDGIALYWDRRISSVQTLPSPTGGLDVFVGIEVAANYVGQLSLNAELAVLVDGVETQTIPVNIDDVFWDQCIGACGSACVMDAVGNFFGTCQEVQNYPTDCTCMWQPIPDIHIPLLLPPGGGGDVLVVLRPAPGALPELPGFPDDEEEVDPNPCPEDLDGDGSIGFGDLTFLLSQWGPCAGCPADLDGDDVVGFGDLTQLLAKWGPCFPV